MKTFAEFLEREAGQVVIGLFIILLGVALWKIGVPEAYSLTLLGSGGTLVSRSMIGSIKNDTSKDTKDGTT